MGLTFSKCGHHMAMGQLECGQCALDEARKADDVAQSCDRGDCCHVEHKLEALGNDLERIVRELTQLQRTIDCSASRGCVVRAMNAVRSDAGYYREE